MHMGIYFQAGRLQSDSSQLQSPLAALAKPQTHEDLGLDPSVAIAICFVSFLAQERTPRVQRDW